MKRKNILLAASLLGSVAIVSTGFAAWVITGNATEEATGSIKVESVSDESYSLEAVMSSDNSVHFGKSDSPVPGWIKDSSSSPSLVDDLHAVVNITSLKKGTSAVTVSPDNIEASLSITTTEGQKLFDKLIEQNYLKYTLTVASTEPVGTGTVTLQFAWGTALGGKNPVDYLNSTYTTYDQNLSGEISVNDATLTSSNTAADYANALLGALYKLNGAEFKITLTTK